MTKQTEAMKLALEALVKALPDMPVHTDWHFEAITALREALAEQPAQQEPGRNHWEDGDVFERIAAIKEQPAQQEPVCDKDPQGCWSVRCQLGKQCKNTPAQRQPLTPEWIWTWLMDWCKRNGTSPANYDSLFRMVSDARAIEAKLKEKNT